jgi:pyruvate dehydrogenase E2 component (dihydrolipoamide acetyltransferase)
MATLDIVIPQTGEGIQEVIVARLLKQAGDYVERDEIIYEMEADKATLQVESPYEGRLSEWLVREGDTLPIGAPIARIEIGSPAMASAQAYNSGNTAVPVPATTSPAPATVAPAKELTANPTQSGSYRDYPLSREQRLWVHRLERSVQLAVPSTVARPLEYGAIERGIQALRRKDPEVPCSEFDIFAFCVAQAIGDHPKFRSALLRDTTIREYDHLNLGVAVQRPNDELVTAVVSNADALDFPAFVQTLHRQIERSLEGEDQVAETTQLLLSYMGAYGITHAVPVLVAPAVAVLFIGAPFQQGNNVVVELILTFDHRLINGVVAAGFLNAVCQKVESLHSETSEAQSPLLSQAEFQRQLNVRSDQVNAIRSIVLSCGPGDRERLLESHLREKVAELLGRSRSEIDSRKPLRTLGVDSRMTVELQKHLEGSLGIPLSSTLIWNYPTIVALAAQLARALDSGRANEGSAQKSLATGFLSKGT